MNIKVTGLIAGALTIASVSFGQKKNETSAAVEYKNKFEPAMMSGDMEAAKKALLSAKEFIDLAAAHPETQESPKTLYYKGEIYSSAAAIAMQTQDSNFMINNFGRDAFEVGIESYRKSYTSSNKFRFDIDNSVNMKINMIGPMAMKMYEDGKFPEAGALFYVQYQLNTAKNVEDSMSLNNAAISFEKAEMFKEAAESYEKLAEIGYKGAYSYALAGSAYTKMKEYDKAKAILDKGRQKFGTDKDLLLELVKLNIAQGDAKGAEAALNEAIAKDPNNKQLHYIIGTIYTDLGENEKAEIALNKALELDPNYLDAQYNLGAHLVTWASTLKQEANQMNLGDTRYEPTIQKSEELFKKALIPLEKYIAAEPKDANVLLILYQLHHNLGNSDKALEYKKRYDEAK